MPAVPAEILAFLLLEETVTLLFDNIRMAVLKQHKWGGRFSKTQEKHNSLHHQ